MTLASADINLRERPVITRSATLAEVAERAGVSKMAVSQVLNPSTNSKTRVSQATRERILEAAVSMNYTPNALARSLRRQKTDVIAFYNAQSVVFDPTFPFYAAILGGVQDGCVEYKKDLLTYANFAGRSESTIISGLHNGQIDGLVLYARALTPLVQRLVESHLPVVTLGEQVAGVPYVGIDEESGGHILAQYLASKGYKRVAYRSYEETDPSSSQNVRKRAFCERAQELGILVLHITHNPWVNHLTSEEEELLLSSERPEAIVCINDAVADRVAEFCRQNSIRVPEDIALVGFDGLMSDRRPALRHTTIQAPWRQVAHAAVGLLVAWCNGEDVPPRTILPVELLEGDTT